MIGVFRSIGRHIECLSVGMSVSKCPSRVLRIQSEMKKEQGTVWASVAAPERVNILCDTWGAIHCSLAVNYSVIRNTRLMVSWNWHYIDRNWKHVILIADGFSETINYTRDDDTLLCSDLADIVAGKRMPCYGV
ncbi:hypothetical protein Zmor_021410 [Zophobas morio]|uniref:Uncharacterized protein n=1 Tax=Zophobas morio TaxID=2755281 RepID=A0AA38I576_9CUCU|nr:hypothetical protein Zmor_021410 [Zophobas morio]